jgi:hypothetical protein
MVEREQLRVSDTDRQTAVDALRQAHDDGRLDLGEYDQRMATAYGAVTFADLDRLFTDLPRPRTQGYDGPFAAAYPPPSAAPYPAYPQPYGYGAMPAPPAYGRYPQPAGPIGQVRSTGLQMLLFFVTLGVWGFVYYFLTHDEIKRHTGEGLGGPLALLINIFAGIASPFLLSHEVGQLYERRGWPRPVSALTGLWVFPGIFLLVGPFVWFIQTNSALNDYWRSVGAR